MQTVLKHLGYAFIWGDFFLVYFFIHALYVGPLSFGEHISTHVSLFLPFFDFIRSLSSVHEVIVAWFFGLPAAFFYSIRMLISTSIGVWLVRRYDHSRPRFSAE